MNSAFLEIMRASDDDRRALFLTTSRRIGTAVQHVEKDFWVSWALDALFNGLPIDGPRLLFKGGTSLSKAYGLIDRFSEDVDVTVYRADLGQDASAEELLALSGKKRQARLDAIKASAQTYINGPLLEHLGHEIEHTMQSSGQSAARTPEGGPRLVRDESDADRQTLLFWYPTVTASSTSQVSGYIRSAVKIESGAKSALDPHQSAIITPYAAGDVPQLDLAVQNVRTVDPERTFWDKLIILHGQRSWFERRGVLRGGGQRISRHYYDVFRLSASSVAKHALADRTLAVDCARHARMFFNSPDLDLAHAIPGTLAIAPTESMMEPLRKDYAAMSGMIFGPVPAFDDVVAAIAELGDLVNA
ncbi:MAG: nucleotidyl transferase AbiEii/AbiGii toxin family protein [Gemmatimonadaceae bacterium]